MDIFSELAEQSNFGKPIRAHGQDWIGIKRYPIYTKGLDGEMKIESTYWLACKAGDTETIPAHVFFG